MKLNALLMLLFCMNLSAGVLAQEALLTVEVENGSIRDVMQTIKQQSEYTFVYNVEEVGHLGNLSVHMKDADIRSILDVCLNGSGLEYSIHENVIVIRKAIIQKQEEIRKIKGIVTDKNKEPLPGVTVMIKGTTLGVSTKAEGRFELVQPKDTSNIELLVSFIGMKTQTIRYKGEELLKVVLEEDTQEMEEVVVTGYQRVDRRKNTSAVKTLNVDNIMIASATSIDQMLEGRVPGMILMTNSGEVGVVPKIRIRGTSTLVGNREPLWVVDGIIVQDPVPIQAEELNDPDYINRIGNAIAGLNPQDIERLDILKDAAATALYGAKAANGVIVVTTKKGHIGKPVINYNMTATFRQRPRYSDRKIDLMNSRERIQVSRELHEQHYKYDYNANMVGYEGLLSELYQGKITDKQFAEKVARLETVNTDWFDLLTEDTFSHQHTLSMSGGSEKTRYYSSIGFTRDNDVIKGNYNQRYTASLNLETTFSQWFTASVQLQGNISKKKYNQDEIAPMDYAYNSSRAIPAYDEEGEYAYYEKYESTSNSYWNYNILNELENSYSKQNASGITVNTNLQFRFTDWLNAQAILSYTNSNTEIEGYWGEHTWHVATIRRANYGETPWSEGTLPFGGELKHNETRQNSYTARLQVNANKYWGADEQHNINASGGFEMSSTRYNGFSSVHRGYYPERGKMFVNNINAEDYPAYAAWAANNTPSIKDDLSNIVSGYLSISYSYRNYFTINVNGRTDGSNRFGDNSNDKFLPIWSASGNYNLTEHDFFKRVWLNYLSFKMSYGYQGNMLSDVSPVLLMQKNPFDPYYKEMTASVNQVPNPNLKWEKTQSLNLGLTVAALDNRIQIEAEYYYKRTKDAFMTKKIATINGLDSYSINGGDIENKGYGIDVTFNPIKSKTWNWLLSTSFSKDFNKVKSDPDSQTYDYQDFLDGTVVVKNKAVNTFYSYKFIGLSPVNGGPMFDDYEDRQYELDGLSKYDTFKKVLTASGRREPYMSGSLSTTLRYKNLRMNGMFAYSLGSKVRLFRTFRYNKDLTIAPESNLHRELLNRWKNPGDEKHTNIPAIIAQNSGYYFDYNEHWSGVNFYNIQTFADNLWDMYDYSDARVVSGNYLKCSNLSFTYEFGERILPKLRLSRLAISLSGTNLFTICSKKLKGQTPTQGFTEVSLSDRPTYSFSLNVSF